MVKRRLFQLLSIVTIAGGFAMTPTTARASDPFCGSGGPGATSCSIGGSGACSVSCGSGYYACCNSNNCDCIKTRIPT